MSYFLIFIIILFGVSIEFFRKSKAKKLLEKEAIWRTENQKRWEKERIIAEEKEEIKRNERAKRMEKEKEEKRRKDEEYEKSKPFLSSENYINKLSEYNERINDYIVINTSASSHILTYHYKHKKDGIRIKKEYGYKIKNTEDYPNSDTIITFNYYDHNNYIYKLHSCSFSIYVLLFLKISYFLKTINSLYEEYHLSSEDSIILQLENYIKENAAKLEASRFVTKNKNTLNQFEEMLKLTIKKQNKFLKEVSDKITKEIDHTKLFSTLNKFDKNIECLFLKQNLLDKKDFVEALDALDKFISYTCALELKKNIDNNFSLENLQQNYFMPILDELDKKIEKIKLKINQTQY